MKRPESCQLRAVKEKRMLNKKYQIDSQTSTLNDSPERSSSDLREESLGPLIGLAFIGANEPLSTVVDRAKRCGVSMEQAAFLSALDDPSLCTPAGVLAALPNSITWMLITDVEHLLAVHQRNREEIRRFLLEIERLAFPREIIINAAHRLGSVSGAVMSVLWFEGDFA
jgi:hypothetical protein